MIAAAAETEAIPAGRGLALVAALVVSVALYATLAPRATIAALVQLDKPPAVLADRAQRILADFGYTDTPADTEQNFRIPPDFPRWLAETDQTTGRWNPANLAKGPALLFWYRTSPRELEPDSPSLTVTPTDPALNLTDMSLVLLDTKGRLVEFRRVPPQHDAVETPSPAPKWEAAFAAAGLSQAAFTSVAPEWVPKDFADARAAWEGPSPDSEAIRIRIEAAAYRGRIVSLYTVGPVVASSRHAAAAAVGREQRVEHLLRNSVGDGARRRVAAGATQRPRQPRRSSQRGQAGPCISAWSWLCGCSAHITFRPWRK